jgi:hypothetical protein
MKTAKPFPFHPWQILLGISLLFCLAALACTPRQSLQSPPMPTLHYINALGSTYTLQPDSLTYDPMKPERSSSGMADGGDPAARAITSGEYQSLKARFEAAIAAKDQHIKTRLKGCGTISVETDGKSAAYFLAMDSPLKSALEASLKTALRQP